MTTLSTELAPSPHRSTKGIIARLLTNLGSAREVDQYLKQYASVDRQRFAVIKVGGGVIEDHLDALASALTFLHQVGLTPIVVHGAGEQLDAALKQEGIESTRVDGLRVTTPQILEHARRTFQRVNLRLVEELESLGTRARPITSGVFEARALDMDRYGLVGEVTRVHLDPVEACIRAGHLPIIACLGETASGQILNINADVAARELAIAVQPHKIIFLTPTGGLLDDKERIIPAVNLAEDYDTLMAQPWVSGGMRLKMQEVKALLDRLPDTTSVSITSPDRLAKELFTHMGSGTLVRRGERVKRFDSFAEIDVARLRTLLETCFQRPLTPDYFATKPLDRLYLTDSYRGAAIVTKESPTPEVLYLDKFAVTQEAQGLGLGASIWSRMRRDVPRMFWRSRANNPINGWYFQQSQGCYRTDTWVVFWYGLSSYDVMRQCVDYALALPPTFMAHGSVV
ncbi:MAG: acetylglutamate kinase [Phycisphaeraceae bacterium]|nr:MAG: acetylglutamate kinase [Phycisphaeraceae bacterium]